jgi:hypothetical protein
MALELCDCSLFYQNVFVSLFFLFILSPARSLNQSLNSWMNEIDSMANQIQTDLRGGDAAAPMLSPSRQQQQRAAAAGAMRVGAASPSSAYAAGANAAGAASSPLHQPRKIPFSPSPAPASAVRPSARAAPGTPNAHAPALSDLFAEAVAANQQGAAVSQQHPQQQQQPMRPLLAAAAAPVSCPPPPRRVAAGGSAAAPAAAAAAGSARAPPGSVASSAVRRQKSGGASSSEASDPAPQSLFSSPSSASPIVARGRMGAAPGAAPGAVGLAAQQQHLKISPAPPYLGQAQAQAPGSRPGAAGIEPGQPQPPVELTSKQKQALYKREREEQRAAEIAAARERERAFKENLKNVASSGIREAMMMKRANAGSPASESSAPAAAEPRPRSASASSAAAQDARQQAPSPPQLVSSSSSEAASAVAALPSQSPMPSRSDSSKPPSSVPKLGAGRGNGTPSSRCEFPQTRLQAFML